MKLQANTGKALSIVAVLVALAAVSTSIWLDPPSDNRARTLDGERVEGMERTQYAIRKYYRLNRVLPADLKVLDSQNIEALRVNWQDPETRQPLEYQIISEKSYRLCARFARNSDPQDFEARSSQKYTAGRDCFECNVTLPEQ